MQTMGNNLLLFTTRGGIDLFLASRPFWIQEFPVGSGFPIKW